MLERKGQEQYNPALEILFGYKMQQTHGERWRVEASNKKNNKMGYLSKRNHLY